MNNFLSFDTGSEGDQNMHCLYEVKIL